MLLSCFCIIIMLLRSVNMLLLCYVQLFCCPNVMLQCITRRCIVARLRCCYVLVVLVLQPKETRVHFFLDNERTETVLANGDTSPSRLSRSADELEKAELPNLQVPVHAHYRPLISTRWSCVLSQTFTHLPISAQFDSNFCQLLIKHQSPISMS